MSAVASAALPDNVHKMNINRKPKSDREISYQVEAGRQLTKARMEKDFEVDQLAEYLKATFVGDVGFNRTSLYKHEKGDRTLTPYRLKCIADALDIPVSSLFDKNAQSREVEKLHSKSEVHAPYNLKKIKTGDALVTQPVNIFENEDRNFEGYYVYVEKDGAVKLCFIIPSEGNTQFAVESEEGLNVYSITDFMAFIASKTTFKHVKYVISKVTE